MPIIPFSEIVAPSTDRFYEVDHVITGHAFDIHNQFGRLLNESLYKRELVRRCRGSGLEVTPEFKISFQHGHLSKDYFVDLFIERGVVVEVKTAECLAPAHRAQTLHYLFASGLANATLINMRPLKVEHEFVSTTYTHASRSEWVVDETRWQPLSIEMAKARDFFLALLAEWGALLDLRLYREAMTHLLGGAEQVIQPVDVFSEGCIIGTHKAALLNPSTGLSITTASRSPSKMREHLQRFLRQTNLNAMAWINMNQLEIAFETIT